MKKLLILFSFVYIIFAVNNGLARTPQMGWNSWNHYGCNINENLIKATADSIASGPLKAAGYEYVNMDDCWASFRDSEGKIQPDPKAFPSGLKALADYVHSKGLKFGLYSDAGTRTCAGRPGSLNYEVKDADSYASWGVDYLKYDNCNNEGIKPEVRYPIMRDALNKTGRPIFYSLCEWGDDNPATWAPAVGNSWRTTGDISDNWGSMIQRADWNNEWAKYAAPGGWNDPDMLEIGNGGMTFDEYKTHFTLWSLMKAPLLVGTDVTKMSAETVYILTAPEVIQVSQDSLGIQGSKVVSGTLEVWAGRVNGGYAVALVNRGSTQASITVRFSDIGLSPSSPYDVRDLWERKSLGRFSGSYSASVPTHGVVFVKVSS
jgi:alpha-galactosidase